MDPNEVLPTNPKFGQLADQAIINETITALKLNGFEAEFVATGAEAKDKLLSYIPAKSRVFNAASQTLIAIGVDHVINESGKFEGTRATFYDPNSTPAEKKRAGYDVDYEVGSVHALTQDGHALIASRSGSQLPGYAYGADQVVWVVGAQKIVKDVDEGIKRIYEYSYPLENERAKQAYGSPSAVNNILIINRQDRPRIRIIIVGEKLGF